MSSDEVIGTSNGVEVTQADVDRMAESAERGFERAALKRRGGRRRMGSAPAEVVPVRIDPELKAAIDARAAADQSTTSEVIREAIRRFLDVAELSGSLFVAHISDCGIVRLVYGMLRSEQSQNRLRSVAELHSSGRFGT